VFENTFIQTGGEKEKNSQEKKPSLPSWHHSNGRGGGEPQYGRSRRSKNSLFSHLVPGACVNICMCIYIHILTRCMQVARAHVCDVCMGCMCAIYICDIRVRCMHAYLCEGVCVHALTLGRGMGCIQSLRMYARHPTTSAQGCRCRLAQ
jgi:hypothetical protein